MATAELTELSPEVVSSCRGSIDSFASSVGPFGDSGALGSIGEGASSAGTTPGSRGASTPANASGATGPAGDSPPSPSPSPAASVPSGLALFGAASGASDDPSVA